MAGIKCYPELPFYPLDEIKFKLQTGVWTNDCDDLHDVKIMFEWKIDAKSI